jgi:3-carboxy-cis,cis-muconate cycloisomerase
MPHKRNPTGCQVALSAAIRAPGLVAGLLAGMPQELERGLGGWQAELPVLAELFGLAHGAIHAMCVVADGLEVDTAAIAAHAAAAPAPAAGRDAALAAAAHFVDEALVQHDAAVARRADR